MTPLLTQRRRALVTALVAGPVVALGLVATAPVATAQPVAAHPVPAVQASVSLPGAKPTVVLVHGAWADASGWTGVVERLRRAGYPVRAVPNPLRSLAGDAASVAAFLSTVPGPVILVGHSYGGAVISAAAAGDPDVKALVYVDAFVPDVGETVLSLAGPDSALAGDPAAVFDAVPNPAGPPGDVDLYLKQGVFQRSFASDLPTRTSATLWAAQRPAAFSAFVTPAAAAAWRTIPSWYLVGTQDAVIPPGQQRFMARRAHAHTVEVRASHLSLISRPGAVSDLIVSAVRAVR